MALSDLLDALGAGEDIDLVCDAVCLVMQESIETEASPAFVGEMYAECRFRREAG